jgi:hypothetical protein
MLAGANQPAGRARRSALTGLSVTADQLDGWIQGINESGGLDEPTPGPMTLNSNRDVAVAIAHAAQDKGGVDTVEDPDVDNFAYRFQQSERKLQLNALQQGRQPETFFTLGRNNQGQIVLRSLHAVGTQGQRNPPIPSDAIAIGHSHSDLMPQMPHGGDASYLFATGKPSFVMGTRNLDLYQIERHKGVAQIRLVRSGGRFGPWERFQADPSKYNIYNDQR